MSISQTHLDRAITLAKAYGATRLILFGSALVQPQQARDLDLACDGAPDDRRRVECRGGLLATQDPPR